MRLRFKGTRRAQTWASTSRRQGIRHCPPTSWSAFKTTTDRWRAFPRKASPSSPTLERQLHRTERLILPGVLTFQLSPLTNSWPASTHLSWVVGQYATILKRWERKTYGPPCSAFQSLTPTPTQA